MEIVSNIVSIKFELTELPSVIPGMSCQSPVLLLWRLLGQRLMQQIPLPGLHFKNYFIKK